MSERHVPIWTGTSVGPLVNTDTIDELTPAAGVTIDGLLIKDGAIPSLATPDPLTVGTINASTQLNATSGTASSSTTTGALVVTGGTGISGDVYVGGDVDIGAGSELRTDTIAEKTADAGVTIDGLLIKDGAIPSLPTYSPSYWCGSSATMSVPSSTLTLSGTLTVTASNGSDITYASSVLDINTTGVYTVSVVMFITYNSTGDRQLQITSHTGSTIHGNIYTKASTLGTHHPITLSITKYFTAGSKIRFQGWQNSGSTLDFTVFYPPNISVVKVG